MEILPTPFNMKSVPTRGILGNVNKWLKEKGIFDTTINKNADNTWVVDNHSYDLTLFAETHPGGKHWIERTRGHDITELYYTHHLDEAKTNKVLKQYQKGQVKNKIPRYTFEQDGLYRTIKRKVLAKYSIEELKDNQPSKNIAVFTVALYLVSFLYLCYTRSYLMTLVCACIMVTLVGLGHNFMHQRINIFRYLYQFTGFSHYEWECFHAISHHIYPNTQLDYEIAAFEPIVYNLRNKPTNPIFIELLLQIFYFLLVPANMILKLILPLIKGQKINLQIFFPYIQLLILYVFNRDLKESLTLFFLMQALFGYIFTKAIFCGHRTPDRWTEGCKKIMDYGEHTLASTTDTTTYVHGFLSYALFAGFNNHITHHLFPTVDHSKLPLLLPIVVQTCKELKVPYTCISKVDCMVEISKGLVKRIPYQSKTQ